MLNSAKLKLKLKFELRPAFIKFPIIPLGPQKQTWKLWRILGTGFPVGFWLGSRILIMIPVLVANYILIGKKPMLD